MWLHVLVLAPLRSFVQSKVRRYRPLIICLTRSNMPLNPEISRFIREHLDDNPDQLLWKKNEYPDDRVVVAVEQIQARENIKEKLPSSTRPSYPPNNAHPRQQHPTRLGSLRVTRSATSRVAWASTRTSFPGKLVK